MIGLLANPIVKWFGIGSLATIAMLSIALFITRGTLHDLRQANKLAEQTRIASAAKREAAWQQALSEARASYARGLAEQQPIIIRSKDMVTRYAQTPDGRALCLAADRVRGIDSFDTDIATATAGGVAAVHDSASAAPK
jgi:hypothetical protein